MAKNAENKTEDLRHEYFAGFDPADGEISNIDSPDSVMVETSVSPSGEVTKMSKFHQRFETRDENGQRTSHRTERQVVVTRARKIETFDSPVIEIPVISVDGGHPINGNGDSGNGLEKMWNGLQHHTRTASQPSMLTVSKSPVRPSSDLAIRCPDDHHQDPFLNDMDMAIEKTLQRTLDTFQRMVEEEREQFLRLFPQLANARVTSTANQAPATEVITERRVQADGRIVEVQRVVTRQVVQVHKTVSMVNGIVKNTTARAVVEYQGPDGGYRVKIEEGDTTPDADSETEEDDDADRASIAPSEFSDTESIFATARKRSLAGKNSMNAVTMGEDSVPSVQTSPKRRTEKAWYAAQELVESERRYVEKLRLLDQVFRTRVLEDPETSKTIGGDKLAKLFSNIGTLYALHNDHLLPQLEDRLREWQETQKMCDVMRKLAPFLKIYSEYTTNYKKATKTYEELRKRNKRFASIIDEIEKLPECDHLPLSNHIICPIQRVTRYHLLMTEYLKNLRDGHSDKEDTAHALELTKKAAAHANDMMRQLDKYKNVIEIQELLGSQISELLTPSRELVKQGRLMKISARNGEHQPRYVFLFNDMLLLCSDRRNVVMSAWGVKYKLRAIFEASSMHVLEGDNLEVENTFYVRSGNKTVELYASSCKEKSEWMDVLWSVVQEIQKRMQSFRKSDKTANSNVGSMATATPTTPPSSSTSGRCSICMSQYGTFKKAYVCKSCTGSFCKKCCQKKLKLLEGEKEQRVCTNCYEKLRGTSTPVSPTPSNQDSPIRQDPASPTCGNSDPNSPDSCAQTQRIIRRRLLDVKPSDSCIISGYLDLRIGNRKSWDRRYFALHEDFVLYSFKSDHDASARTSMPITGCKASWVDPRQDSTIGKEANAFKIEQKRRTYYMRASGPEEMAKWVAALDLASQAQFPITGA